MNRRECVLSVAKAENNKIQILRQPRGSFRWRGFVLGRLVRLCYAFRHTMEIIRFQDLTLEDQFLLDEAERAMANAYAPYSQFHVGAAIRTMYKRTYLGTNMENAAYSAAICAERAALTALNTANDRAIESLAVIATSMLGPVSEPVMPCGICRQCLYEFADLVDRDFVFICSDSAKSKIVVGTVRELLPRGFGPSTLRVRTDAYRPLLPKPSL